MKAYKLLMDNEIDASKLMDDNGIFFKAVKLFDIELVESIRFKCGKAAYKYFNYMLIDGRIFRKFVKIVGEKNGELDEMILLLFLSGCFYLGKGQADRPFKHLKEALNHETKNEKVNYIRKLWGMGEGVVILTFLHGSSSKVASTREALMMDYIGLDTLTNVRQGTFYAGVGSWEKSALENLAKSYITQLMLDCIGHHVVAVFKEDIE